MRVANQAGAAPKSMPVVRARVNAKASTSGEGIVSIGRKVVPAKANASSSRAVPTATARPTMPPSTASSTLSSSACVTICRREAPSASRTAVWPRRATARASSRLATFAQAISSTSPHTPNRMRRLRLYCSRMIPTPAPAGTTAIDCCGRSLITPGIQLAG